MDLGRQFGHDGDGEAVRSDIQGGGDGVAGHVFDLLKSPGLAVDAVEFVDLDRPPVTGAGGTGGVLEEVRVDTARRRLEESELSIEAVALACGFGNAGSFRRLFTKAVGVSPIEYRRTFATTRLVGGLELAV